MPVGMTTPLPPLAGLLYHGGAWWVTSVRGAGEEQVISGLRAMAPDYPRERLRAVPWPDANETAYQEAVRTGGYLIVRP